MRHESIISPPVVRPSLLPSSPSSFIVRFIFFRRCCCECSSFTTEHTKYVIIISMLSHRIESRSIIHYYCYCARLAAVTIAVIRLSAVALFLFRLFFFSLEQSPSRCLCLTLFGRSHRSRASFVRLFVRCGYGSTACPRLCENNSRGN